MPEFNSENCPTSSELLEYFAGLETNASSNHSVSRHLNTCAACRSVFAKLQETGPSEGMCPDPSPLEITDPALSVLDRQRAAMSLSLTQTMPEVKPGQVWALTLPQPSTHDIGSEMLAREFEDFSPIVLVLRSFIRHATGRQVVDILPITDDPTFAAEWSIVFSAAYSGFEMPIVAHLDYQFTTSPAHLARYLGSISESAWLDLAEVNRAWGQADVAPTELSVGRIGQLMRRDWPEWRHFDAIWGALTTTLQSQDDKDLLECDDLSTVEGTRTFGHYLTCFVRDQSFRDLHHWCSHEAQQASPQVYSQEGLWHVVEQISKLPVSLYSKDSDWHIEIKHAIGTAVPPVVYKLVHQSISRYAHKDRDTRVLGRKAARHQEI